MKVFLCDMCPSITFYKLQQFCCVLGPVRFYLLPYAFNFMLYFHNCPNGYLVSMFEHCLLI